MIKIETKGINTLVKKFDQLSKEGQADVQSALNSWADVTAKDAKLLAPSNFSGLRTSINPEYYVGSAAVVASVKYAAYVEFGTRKFAASYVASLPPDWQAYANTFKGPASDGGNLKQMWEAFKIWGDKKGLTRTHTYFAYKKVLRDGIRPQPFLYPSVYKNLPQLIKDIKDIYS
jgi:HK97 gp10 family phage protein